jgi:hypothetical protein
MKITKHNGGTENAVLEKKAVQKIPGDTSLLS